MEEKYIKDIIEEYLQNRYPEETEELIRAWLTDEEKKDEKYEALLEHWNQLQVEPDIFIYDSLALVKERIDELPELLEEEEIPPEPVVPAVSQQPVAEEPVTTGPATIEEPAVALPVIQLSAGEITEAHTYEMPEGSTIISKKNGKEEQLPAPEELPVIQLKKPEEDKTEPVIPAPAAVTRPAPVTPPPSPWTWEEEPEEPESRPVAWWKVAAVLIPFLLLAGGAAYMYFSRQVVADKLVVEQLPDGENRRIQLPDGSTVRLAGGSTLSYPETFTGKSRTVTLSGEGYFSVNKDPERPFRVKTPAFDIQVTGTEFNLKMYPEDERGMVTLVSGGIRVEMPAEESYTLQPAQQLIFDKRTTETVIHTLEPGESWKEEELFFYNVTFPEIARTLERRLDVTFRTDSALIEPEETYTVKFVNGENTEEILQVLEQLVGFEWEKTGRTIVVKAKE